MAYSPTPNFLQNIANGFRRFFVGVPKVSVNDPTPQPFSFSSGSVIAPSPSIDSHQAIEAGFERNATIYSILTASGSKFGSLPYFVYNDATTKEQKRLSNQFSTKAQALPYVTMADMNKPNIVLLNNLLQRPNRYQSQDVFKSEVYQWKAITGNCFIWCNRGITYDQNFATYDTQNNQIDDAALDKMQILEMYILPTNYISLIPDPTDPWDILGYVFNIGGTQAFLRKQDVIHWKNASLRFDPITRSHLWGVSPLQAGGALLQQNTASQIAGTRAAQQNGAGGILMLDSDGVDSLAPGQADDVRNSIDRNINNNDRSGGIAFLLGKYDFLDLNKAADLPLLDGQKYSDQQLCMLFQYPIEMMQSQTTFANKEMATKNWLNNHIIPSAITFTNELNRVLLKSFNLEGQVKISCDYSNLPELQDNNLEQAQALAAMPFLTWNEKRIAFGYYPLEDAICDQLMIPQGVIPSDQLQNELDSMNQDSSGDYPGNNTDNSDPKKNNDNNANN